MELLISIVLTVFGVLQIILFFKLWGMTNDVREIKNKLISTKKPDNLTNVIQSSEQDVIETDSYIRVIELETQKQMMKGEKLDNGRYKCYTTDNIYIGDFDLSEFMEFDKWVKEVYKK